MAKGTLAPRNVAGHRRPVRPMSGFVHPPILRAGPGCAVMAESFGSKHAAPEGDHGQPLARTSRRTTPTSRVCLTTPSPYLRATTPCTGPRRATAGRGFWSVTRHDDVLQVSRNPEIFSSRQGIRLEDMDPEETEARRTMMEMDAPEHTRLRRLVSRPFAPRSIAEYEDVGAPAGRRGPRRAQRGTDVFDFVRTVARELPMRMLGRLLGLPDDDLEWLVQRGDALIGNTDPDFTDYVVDQVDTSDYRLLPFRSPVALELFEYATQALEEAGASPTHDVLSACSSPTPTARRSTTWRSRTSSPSWSPPATTRRATR